MNHVKKILCLAVACDCHICHVLYYTSFEKLNMLTGFLVILSVYLIWVVRKLLFVDYVPLKSL